jgi:hypothetical protein
VEPIGSIPFGKHKDRPLSTVPTDYLQWAVRSLKLSSGLRAALSAELACRGVEVPPAPPLRPLPACQRCPGVRPLLSWLQDSLGRDRIKIECARCHQSLGFAPQVSPYVEQANATASKTPVLDALTRFDAVGVELESDGKRVYYSPGAWQRVPPDLRRLVDQCRHLLARMIGKTTLGG